ncbi:MAG TPA: formate--tetrahydrofolate ligase [Methylophilus sp.]|nr:formate--tetrahydrofolate ligase [Methylophilus sp.]HQQ33497.1 formate--tetrahydrofolate ligase [Methylophilus sp.]
MLSDIEIAQAAKLKPISGIAKRLGITRQDLIPYGEFVAKLSQDCLSSLSSRPDGKLILVTAISPTPAGEGKTTTTIGLADALCKIGKKAMVCIREPSMGPVFGMKGGATGGGYAQVVPMENINLHFTGDFHAITSANNLLAALIDNHIHQGNLLDIDPKTITWRRCMDMNDRALRHVHLRHKDYDTDTGFDITVASEVMAIFCLAKDLDDLKVRLGNIQIAQDMAGKPILASDLQAQGAMTAILKDAFQPNLVQTLAHTPALIHGGPFANIAHGCNSVVATKTALKLADYVVTEAGFGADLGAEKFLDIKCRNANLQPEAVVLVATIRALKYHGGCELAELNQESVDCLLNGINNISRHINNLHEVFGLPVTVAINHFSQDTPKEIQALTKAVEALNCKAVLCRHWARGARGAVELARNVVEMLEQPNGQRQYCYDLTASLEAKVHAVASRIYAAGAVEYSERARVKLERLAKDYPNLPICIAKTQYSFSSDPKLRNAPNQHVLKVSDLRLSRGAGFIVVLCGDIMTMPGLPKSPASSRIDVVDGRITGVS